MARENWQRSYVIEIGTPELTESLYFTTGSSTGGSAEVDQLTIPSNAVRMSNLKQDDKEARGFTFTFETQLGASNNGSKNAEVTKLRLYNLDQATVNIIERKRCIVRVYAGYGNEVNLAYAGDVTKVRGAKQGSDYIYELTCSTAAVDFKTSMIVADYLEDKSVADVIKDLINRFPTLAFGNSDLVQLEQVYESGGFSWQGNLVDALQYFIDKYNLTLASQNGKISLYPYKVQDYSEDFLFGPGNNFELTSDLIKDIQPAQDNKQTTAIDKKDTGGVVVNTFFLPIEVSQFFTIPEAKTAKDNKILNKYAGTYKVEKLRIKLESHGNFWDVAMTGKRI